MVTRDVHDTEDEDVDVDSQASDYYIQPNTGGFVFGIS